MIHAWILKIKTTTYRPRCFGLNPYSWHQATACNKLSGFFAVFVVLALGYKTTHSANDHQRRLSKLHQVHPCWARYGCCRKRIYAATERLKGMLKNSANRTTFREEMLYAHSLLFNM